MEDASQFESFTAKAGEVAFVTFMVFISVIGALANITVIVSIFANHNLRTKTNYVVLSLAVSDFFVATVAIPLRLLEELNTSNGTLVPCNVVLAFTILFDGISRLNIVLISFDRFMAVKYPFSYDRHASKRSISIAITVFWTAMGLFAIGLLSGLGVRNDEEENVKADFISRKKSRICLLSSTLSEAAVVTFTIGFCSIPVLIVVPINCYLVKTSYWHIKKIQDLHESVEANYNVDRSDMNTRNLSQELTLRHRKRAKMVAVLVCFFVVLVAPITIIDVIETFCDQSVPPYLSKSAVCLIYLNTSVNMFVYAAFNKEFRDAFYRILKVFLNRCSR